MDLDEQQDQDGFTSVDTLYYIKKEAFIENMCVMHNRTTYDLVSRIFDASCNLKGKMSFKDYLYYYDILHTNNVKKK